MAAESSEPIVCQLTKAAVTEITEIERDSNAPPWSASMIEDEFAHPHSRIFGARLGQVLAGYLLSHVILEEAHIAKFGVRRQLRRQGIGRCLLVHALREFHSEAVQWVSLEVRVGNVAARALYEQLGFQECGVREKYYSDNGEDACVMRLNIRQFLDRYGDA